MKTILTRFFGTIEVALAPAVAIAMLTVTGEAQNSAARSDNAASDAAPTPRMPDGKPNLGRVDGEKGIWMVPYIQNMADWVMAPDGTPIGRLAQAAATGGAGRGDGRGGGEGRGGGPAGGPASGRGSGRGGSKSEPYIPFMPWSAAVYDYNSANSSKYDPEGYCLPPGGPRMMATPYPMEIVQLPGQQRILMIFEGATHIWREIYMDGRPHPTGDALNPSFLGHSVGRWDADTLVIDVVGFNENTWVDYYGHPHTDRLHVIERISRPNKNTLRYEATVDDTGAYTRPWTVAWTIPWNPTGELQEYICQENNRYLQHLTDDFGQPVFGPR